MAAAVTPVVCPPEDLGNTGPNIPASYPTPLVRHPIMPSLVGPDAKARWVAAYQADPLLQDPKLVHKYQLTLRDDFWYCNTNRLVVPSLLRPQVLHQCHNALSSAHFGITKTINQVARNFWWPSFRMDTHQYIRDCLSCAKNKPGQHKPYGLLSPLPVPERPWDSVSMDFITDLPKTPKGNDSILVMVDRFSKMVHFAPCAISCTAPQAADLCVQHVLRLHGCPSSFVVDRDPRWRSSFMSSWCHLLNINLAMSSAFHPQTDGQTERMKAGPWRRSCVTT
jgi:Integrase zinc binding domain